MKFDRTDRGILHALQTDGRMSNVTLAQAVNLSESACLRRVRQLEDAGICHQDTTCPPLVTKEQWLQALFVNVQMLSRGEKL